MSVCTNYFQRFIYFLLFLTDDNWVTIIHCSCVTMKMCYLNLRIVDIITNVNRKRMLFPHLQRVNRGQSWGKRSEKKKKKVFFQVKPKTVSSQARKPAIFKNGKVRIL